MGEVGEGPGGKNGDGAGDHPTQRADGLLWNCAPEAHRAVLPVSPPYSI